MKKQYTHKIKIELNGFQNDVLIILKIIHEVYVMII